MKRILTILGVLVAVFAIGTFVYTSLPQDWSVSFPGKTKVRVHAPPASTQEDIRYITYPDKDSRIPEQEQIEYKNGVTGYIFYRPDGTIRETTEYWPAVEGIAQRQLKSGSPAGRDVSDRHLLRRRHDSRAPPAGFCNQQTAARAGLSREWLAEELHAGGCHRQDDHHDLLR